MRRHLRIIKTKILRAFVIENSGYRVVGKLSADENFLRQWTEEKIVATSIIEIEEIKIWFTNYSMVL